MLRYLQAFAATFQLHQYVKFGTEVIKAVPLSPTRHGSQNQVQIHNTAASSRQDHEAATSRHPDSHSGLPWPKWEITTKAVHHTMDATAASAQQHEQAQDKQSSPKPQTSNGVSSSSGMEHSDSHSNGNLSHACTDRPAATSDTAEALSNGHSQANSAVATGSDVQTAIYDALVVCNGHYSAPRCPDVNGSATFPGLVMHSHNYRDNASFRGQVVVLVGASASGEDICREIAEVADKVT